MSYINDNNISSGFTKSQLTIPFKIQCTSFIEKYGDKPSQRHLAEATAANHIIPRAPPKMSDDEDILVERDENCRDRMNGTLINVAPFNGLENIGYDDDEISESDVADQYKSRKASSQLEESDFIMALFVVVFDTKHGMCEL